MQQKKSQEYREYTADEPTKQEGKRMYVSLYYFWSKHYVNAWQSQLYAITDAHILHWHFIHICMTVLTEGRNSRIMSVCNTTSIVSLPAHLFEPSLLHQLITVVREEWSSIWQEGSSHQTVSNQIPHAHLQFLSGKATSIATSYYVHRAYHKYNDTLTFSSHRILSPASPDTSLAARSSRSSVSSAFFRSSSLWASFSSYCRCSSSSLSFTSRNFSFASWRMACFSASLWFASSNFWKGKQHSAS